MKDDTSTGDGRILVVDDDPEMRSFIKDLLCSRSHKVDLAASAGEAILKLMERRYELAIMDIRMPLMDGITCLRQCQNLDPEMPVIMISGEATSQETLSALRSGAIEFMEKPLRMGPFLRLIEKALGKRSFDRVLRHYQGHPSEASAPVMICDSIRPITHICGADLGMVIRVKDGSQPELVASTSAVQLPASEPFDRIVERSEKDAHFIIRTIEESPHTRLVICLKRNGDHSPFEAAERAEAESAVRMIGLAVAA